MRLVGVDPGKSGAFTLFEDGVLKEIVDMPLAVNVVRGVKRSRPVPALIADLFQEWKPNFVLIEQVGVRPMEGAVGAFAFGRGFGGIEGVVAALDIPSDYVLPATWKRSFQLIGTDKSASRMKAMSLFPTFADKFKRVKDDGRAEAALIGFYAFHLVQTKNGQ